MDKHEQLGPWIRRFLLEHLIRDRNLSPNTQRSYRDTLTMLLPFIAAQVHKPLDRLEVADLSAGHARLFLAHLEQARRVSAATRNQRLAAIHSLARFIAESSAQHVAWYGEIRNVRFKKTIRGLIPYLDKPEVEALLAVPDCTTSVGNRNYVRCYSCTTRELGRAKQQISVLLIWTWIRDHTREPACASSAKAGRYDDAHSGKKRRCNSPNLCKGALRQNGCS